MLHLLHRLAVIAFLLITLPSATLAQSMVEGRFRADIPTLEQVIGHRTGTQITSPEEALTYLRALQQAAPERMRLVEYARSWQGRPLVYAVITSAPNMARIEAVKADLARLGAGASPAQLANLLPVTWLGYGVHGDEISSTDAALALVYHLLASEGDAGVDRILNNTVVIIDPSQNPDGRARFVHSYRSQAGLAVSADRHTAAADQPWPGGRFNHYLFDLNRDWFALTQPETRGRVAAMRQWQPVVVVDAHEMGGDETYFFPPVADPINPNVTPSQRALLDLLGRANAAAMDAIGQPYFTREVFDLFYPGYGDSWPTLNGAIGMTFEQASARGMAWERRDGTLLTYAEGVRNHFVTTLATAQTVADNAQRFLDEYARYRNSAASGAAGSGAYVIDLGLRRWNAESLARRLVAQGIAVNRVNGPASACSRTYPSGYLAISRSQPAARLIRSLLDAETPLPADFVAKQEDRRDRGLAHELYDTTAWSVGLMSGLDVALCNGPIAAGTAVRADEPLASRVDAPGAFGLVVPWTDSGQARLVALALARGLVGRSTDTAFTVDGRTFGRGSVVFARSDNPDRLDELAALAREVGAEAMALTSGWTDSGPNLGSDRFARLAAPRVAMLWDDGVDPLSAGALRYTLEQRLGVAVAPIRTRNVTRAELGRYSVLLVSDGNYANALGETGRDAIASYARSGGVVVAVGEALGFLSEGDESLFALARETVLGGNPESAQTKSQVGGTAIASEAAYRAAIADGTRRPDTMPGALLNTAIESDSFLSAGYDNAAPVVFASGDLVFAPLVRAKGVNVVRLAAPDRLVASGYLWDENRRQMAFKPYMVAQPAGSGLAVGFVYDPATRGYLDGLDLLLANAVMVAPARVRG